MIRKAAIYHSGWFDSRAAAVERDGPLKGSEKVRIYCMALVVWHERLGPIMVDAPMDNNGLNRFGMLLRLTNMIAPFRFEPSFSARQRLLDLDVDPGSVQHILMTHLHYDHTGGLPDFPDAAVHTARLEWREATTDTTPLGIRHGYWYDDINKMQHRIELFDTEASSELDGLDLFGDGSIRAIALPGHSNGHTGFLFRMSSGRELLFYGDAAFTIRHITDDVGLGPFPRRVATSKRHLDETVEKLREWHRDNPDLVFWGSHDPVVGEHAKDAPLFIE